MADSIKVVDRGWRSVSLQWEDDENWEYPWLIQRSTDGQFEDPTSLRGNQSTDTYRWLGINADNYVDIDGLERNTEYHFRVAVCKNLAAHYSTGETPVFSEWIYGQAKTRDLKASRRRVYDVTEYGAIPDDGENDYPATLKALKAAQRAGGGTLYFPEGKYDIWPVDKDVTVIDGIPTLKRGGSATNMLFQIRADNITFLGDVSEAGDPTTVMNFFLWEKVPATKWLHNPHGRRPRDKVRRYYVFTTEGISDFTLRNIDFDLGAVPVVRTKEWYTEEHIKHEWDISHKMFMSDYNHPFRNCVIDNIRVSNCRGEVIFSGGFGEKILIKDSVFTRSNSSTLSGSYDLELVNTVIRDSANAALESAIASGVRSRIAGRVYNQNHIARGCTFIGLDQSEKGFMKNLEGDPYFSLWHCFNQEGTYQSVTDSTFTDYVKTAYAPWYECRNAFRYNCVFNEPAEDFASQVISLNTTGKEAYNLEGGMSHVLWLGDTFNVDRYWNNHRVILTSWPGGAAVGNQSPWIWEQVHFRNLADTPTRINVFWQDGWWPKSGRQEAVFRDWTKDDDVSFSHRWFWAKDKEKKIHPKYVNFFGQENPAQ